MREKFSLVFGLFLGFAMVKFGNPVVLDRALPPPSSFAEAWVYAWPGYWSYWLLVPLTLAGIGMIVAQRARLRGTRWLWILPLAWGAWQLISSTQTVDARLTGLVLGQFGGCLAAYFLGSLLFNKQQALRWLLVGILAGFTWCLVRAIDQRCFEFPQEQRLLMEGERTGWTNLPPDLLARLRAEKTIIRTNGIELANPLVMAKYKKARVHGTLMYPNALAGAVLLLWPALLATTFSGTRRLTPWVRWLACGVAVALGGLAFFWSGSKLAWLIGMGLLCLCGLRLKWTWRWKAGLIGLLLVIGAVVFVVRFQDYFAAGATSLGARVDYWRAAAQIVSQQPWLGSGPGTFQRPYSHLKSPESEMARLVHNDYLEQFSDSGIPGGVIYLAWIILALSTASRRIWRGADAVTFAVLLGLLGWFAQGIGEFSLYIPALAWSSFALLGACVAGETERGRGRGRSQCLFPPPPAIDNRFGFP